METPAPIKDSSQDTGSDAAQTAAAQQPAPARQAQAPDHDIPRTTGEKWFKTLRFAVAEAVILTFTAGIAYVARFGNPKYDNINVFRKIQKWTEDDLMKNFKNKGGTSELFAKAVGSTMVTFHGGNVFAPVMKGLENHKAGIVNYVNSRYGKPGELEQGKERLAREEKETWGDVIKGRLAAWAAVFTGFFAADMIAGQTKEGVRRFDKVSAGFGKWVAGFTREGKKITDVPLKELIEHPPKNKPYLFGSILALDIFATTAAVAIWTSISKVSAIMRRNRHYVEHEQRGNGQPQHAEAPAQKDAAPAPAAQMAEPEKNISHAARIGDRPADFRGLAEKEPAPMAMSQ